METINYYLACIRQEDPSNSHVDNENNIIRIIKIFSTFESASCAWWIIKNGKRCVENFKANAGFNKHVLFVIIPVGNEENNTNNNLIEMKELLQKITPHSHFQKKTKECF
jgi:hypothetical protein